MNGTTKKTEITNRRLTVAQQYLSCTPIFVIAANLGVCTKTVELDLRALRAEWKQQYQEAWAAKVDQECARLDRIESEAWESWEKSKKAVRKTRTRVERNDGTNEQTEKSETTDIGDPRWLEIILSVAESRRKLVGLNAPKEANLNVQLSAPPTREDMKAAVFAAIRRVQAGAGVVEALPETQEEEDVESI